MDVVRKILLTIADKSRLPANDEIDSDLLQYHLWVMQEAGLVDNFSRFGPEGGVAKNSIELTWQGNEFLDAARNDSFWSKAKEIAINKTGSISFELVKAILVGLAQNAVR